MFIYHFMYDFARTGIPVNVQILDDSTMCEVMSYNWSGKEFSKRIWGHEQETMQNIRKTLEQSFIIGRSIDRTAKEIVRVADVAYSRAEALVRTEANFFHNLAAHNSYRDAGMEKYEILATLDMRTSDICRSMDGKVYEVKNYKPGTTAPPFHVRCRTTTIPYFDESEYTKGEKRQSMNGLVDSVSYEEWYNKHIRGHKLEVKDPNVYSAQYLQKMNKTFEYFKEKGFIFREHAVNRALGQKQGKGKRDFTNENVLDVLKTGKKYHQAEGNKTVYFKDGIAVIQANDTGEIVSIVTRKKPKKDWREIDG
ncbi:minor capsid protein [Geobacillus proteiniphilus]|uniref:Minor capsid protein n=1 Tax=Geobacillus proteiniphilus TaxID=860353 RepID=A0A1Q5SN78_9BACL|nr:MULTISPECIES: minor capsid protein [Geobacillus]OKO89459.1 Phage minor capsid protein [Geobacillus proteiniphilus]WMJ16765.1 minor capsid protein [Geobacillus proteiniphilus]